MNLPQTIVIERVTNGTEDEYGNPAQTWTALGDPVAASVQPKKAQDMALLSQGGPVISDHTIYLYPTALNEGDRIRFDPDDGRLYQVDGVRDAAGRGHHLEVDAHMVTND
jgi:SPP1 family predicted phage head-tail adaptor